MTDTAGTRQRTYQAASAGQGWWLRLSTALWRRPWARAALLLTPPLAWFLLVVAYWVAMTAVGLVTHVGVVVASILVPAFERLRNVLRHRDVRLCSMRDTLHKAVTGMPTVSQGARDSA